MKKDWEIKATKYFKIMILTALCKLFASAAGNRRKKSLKKDVLLFLGKIICFQGKMITFQYTLVSEF
jgi:hypothetical protein